MSQATGLIAYARRGHAFGRDHAVGSTGSIVAAQPSLCAGEVIRRLRGRGTVSAAELRAAGISPQYASQLRQRGILERVAHGQSRLAHRFDHATS
ncbi:type IV toxin-antitoxin system AbiEi family antitoxin domain-containing protein [Sphingomonas kyeonggiensis]|uniref:AbiEi antitoxin N-terminal domain-containing protein n=1 Tax=Sphingomonas kyeonggiensis TaxID=1268553 RepID=A0A7W6JZ81_9SPHN|nr:type IV toxin-antitoxin system AbiEi family antitoxin domain-containing protein [Sphingomonas kyeonggiensis]MBB4101180.1 hypothetical protein [Sphingomonas kyeonggiensis]